MRIIRHLATSRKLHLFSVRIFNPHRVSTCVFTHSVQLLSCLKHFSNSISEIIYAVSSRFNKCVLNGDSFMRRATFWRCLQMRSFFYKTSSLKIFCLYINGNAKRQHMISKKAFWEIFPAVWRPRAQVWSRGLICKVWQARFLLYNQRSGNISENLICRQICVGLDLKF